MNNPVIYLLIFLFFHECKPYVYVFVHMCILYSIYDYLFHHFMNSNIYIYIYEYIESKFYHYSIIILLYYYQVLLLRKICAFN